MKFQNAIKRLSKLGELKKSGCFYYVEIGNKRLIFIDNGGKNEDAICFHIDYYNEDGKYHTSYYDNMTQMIKSIA